MTDTRSTLWFIRQMLVGKYRLRVAAAVATMLLATIAETFGIAAILPVLILASESSGSGSGGVSEKLRMFFDQLGWHPPLEMLLFIVVAGIGLKGLLGLLGQQLVARGSTQIAADFRSDLIRALMASRWNYMIVQPAGAIANAISVETIRASGLFSATVLMIVAVLSTIPFALLALGLSWQFTVTSVAVCAFLMLILHQTVLQTRRHSRELSRSSRSLVTRLVDSIVSLKPLKAMALQDRVWPFLETEIRQLTVSERRQSFSKSLQGAIQEPVVALIICVGM
jgi:ATP-binding cassette subfamily C protein